MIDWEQLFSASAKKLGASLEEARASVDHRGIKGHLNEEAFTTWLKPLLPGALDATTGEIIDSLGGTSRQADVVIFDKMTTSRVFSRGGIDVLPIEPVFAVVEIKAYLNKSEVENAFENMLTVKTLKKVAYHEGIGIPNTISLYGIPQDRWPVQFFVFAYESDGLDTVLGHVERLNLSRPINQRIDAVCVLDKGLIINTGPDGLQPIPMPNTHLIAKPSAKALLTFYTVLSHLLGQSVTKPMAMHPYLAHIVH